MLRSSGNIGPGLGLGSELSTLISPESNRASTGYFVLELNINGTWTGNGEKGGSNSFSLPPSSVLETLHFGYNI